MDVTLRRPKRGFGKQILLSALASTVAIAAWLAVNAAPAHATIRVYKNLATGYCLDSNAGGRVYTLWCNRGSFQKWNVTGANTVTLRNLATGRCLDSNAARQVYTLGCNGGSYQRWRVTYNRDGSRTFRNLATGYCLDSNAARVVYTHPCNGGSYQRWRLG